MKKLFAIALIITSFVAGTSVESLSKHFVRQPSFIISPAALYQSDNELYFDNKLPKNIEIVEQEAPDGEADYGLTLHATGTHWYKMFVSPTLNDSITEERWTVLHESCHIRIWENHEADGTAQEYKKRKGDGHGDEWQNCMKDLAMKDAFHDIW